MKVKIAAITGLILIPFLLYTLLTREPNNQEAAKQPQVSSFCSPAMPESATVVAGYGEIINPTPEQIQITSIKCDDTRKAEFHTTTIDENGDMEMSQLETVIIPAFQTFKMEPNGNHIMIYLEEAFGQAKFFRCTVTTSNNYELTLVSSVKESCE